MTVAALSRFFEVRRQRGESLVLATVYETEGSTYSKAGARMLIDANGVFQGMLSGGCLEGDLAIRAQIVAESQQAQRVTYDLGSDADELWGLGTGCDGTMRILLQPLTPAQDYRPWPALVGAWDGQAAVVASTVIESTAKGIAAGATTIHVAAAAAKLPRLEHDTHAGAETLTLHHLIRPAPRLVVLGAGLDAVPVVRFAAELGWKCTVADHRPAYIDNGDFGTADVCCCAAAALAASVELDRFDFAIVMSHHLATDRTYLAQLADADVPYVGLLGPPGRRERLLSGNEGWAARLDGRLHGPAGIDLGGRGPAAIALSIVAEMQQTLPRD